MAGIGTVPGRYGAVRPVGRSRGDLSLECTTGVGIKAHDHGIAGRKRVIVKPSEHSPQTGLTVDWLFRQLRDHGLPEDIVQSVVGGKEHGKQLVEQDVALVAFTGSTLAGKDIAANSADKLHRVLLELGGLDAAIVLKDTNVANTAREMVMKNSALTGQVCNSI